MAILTKDEIRGMSIDDAQKKIVDIKKELIKENAQIATGTTPKSPGKVREMKKSVARLLTKINKEKANQ